jgi:DNA-binding NarL/FixJ family response regulator
MPLSSGCSAAVSLIPKEEQMTSGESAGSEPPYGLTETERRVLRLLSDGLADEDISRTLGITCAAVNQQISKILEKMDTRSRTVAVITAMKRGLLLLGAAWAVALLLALRS